MARKHVKSRLLYLKRKIFHMADDASKAILAILGLLFAAVVGKVAWDAATKKYQCPRCNYPVSKGQSPCPNCGQPLDWKGVQ